MSKIDQGLGSILLLTFASALAVVLAIGVPIVLAPEPVKLSDWLGFAGAIAGFTGAVIVAKIAVAPVWRQVNIMGAQAALQLYPILQQDLSEIDKDTRLLSYVGKIRDGAQNVTAQVDFSKVGDRKLAEALASELINLRGKIDNFAEEEWQRFYGRLRLSESIRDQRKALRRRLNRIRDESLELTQRQRTPEGTPRSDFMEQIAGSFVTDVHQFFEKAASHLSIDLTLQAATIARERERLLLKGSEFRKATENI